MSTTMDQREALLAEFTDAQCETLFGGAVSQERLDELMEIIRCDIPAARLALQQELERIANETTAALPPSAPLANPIPL
jgi:hypothetical protein